MAQLTAKAEAYCAAAEHCMSEMRSKLQQWEATEEQCDEIIAHLVQHNYIDEQRYCHAFVHDKLLYQGWGRMKMRVHLQAKYLPAAAIKQALEEIEEQTYQEVLQKVITTKQRSLIASDHQDREKLIRFCLQRGFTYEEIS